jgi:hypothetical protein
VLPRWLGWIAVVTGPFFSLQSFGICGGVSSFGLTLDLSGFLLFLDRSRGCVMADRSTWVAGAGALRVCPASSVPASRVRAHARVPLP